MTTFNLTEVVTFPTRICNNIFLDRGKFNNITVNALDNRLSDHIAQILTLVNMKVPISKQTYTRKTRVMDIESRNNFQSHLIIIIIIIIIFIYCNWVVTRWQWLFYMKLVTTKFYLGGLHEKHVVATWNLGSHLSIYF